MYRCSFSRFTIKRTSSGYHSASKSIMRLHLPSHLRQYHPKSAPISPGTCSTGIANRTFPTGPMTTHASSDPRRGYSSHRGPVICSNGATKDKGGSENLYSSARTALGISGCERRYADLLRAGFFYLLTIHRVRARSRGWSAVGRAWDHEGCGIKVSRWERGSCLSPSRYHLQVDHPKRHIPNPSYLITPSL